MSACAWLCRIVVSLPVALSLLLCVDRGCQSKPILSMPLSAQPFFRLGVFAAAHTRTQRASPSPSFLLLALSFSSLLRMSCRVRASRLLFYIRSSILSTTLLSHRRAGHSSEEAGICEDAAAWLRCCSLSLSWSACVRRRVCSDALWSCGDAWRSRLLFASRAEQSKEPG